MKLDPTEPYSVAKGYVQSAYSMMANPHRLLQLQDDISLFMAFHMLCGFATELYLKAFLAHKGYDDAQLKQRPFGHDLVRLRDQCRLEGLYSSGADKLVDLLFDKHKNFEFRYMKRSSLYETIDLRAIFFAFSSLDRLVDTAIGASVSKYMTLGRRGWRFPSDGLWRLPGANA